MIVPSPFMQRSISRVEILRGVEFSSWASTPQQHLFVRVCNPDPDTPVVETETATCSRGDPVWTKRHGNVVRFVPTQPAVDFEVWGKSTCNSDLFLVGGARLSADQGGVPGGTAEAKSPGVKVWLTVRSPASRSFAGRLRVRVEHEAPAPAARAPAEKPSRRAKGEPRPETRSVRARVPRFAFQAPERRPPSKTLMSARPDRIRADADVGSLRGVCTEVMHTAADAKKDPRATKALRMQQLSLQYLHFSHSVLLDRCEELWQRREEGRRRRRRLQEREEQQSRRCRGLRQEQKHDQVLVPETLLEYCLTYSPDLQEIIDM